MGSEEAMRMQCPRRAKRVAYDIVRRRPRYLSAMIAPIKGVVYAKKELNMVMLVEV